MIAQAAFRASKRYAKARMLQGRQALSEKTFAPSCEVLRLVGTSRRPSFQRGEILCYTGWARRSNIYPLHICENVCPLLTAEFAQNNRASWS
jgi:hypothetical protein